MTQEIPVPKRGLTKYYYKMPIGQRISLLVVGISAITLVIVVYIALISTTVTLRQETTDTLIRQNRNIASALDRSLFSVNYAIRDRLAPRITQIYEPGIDILDLRSTFSDVMRTETNLLFSRIGIYVPGEPIPLFNFQVQTSGRDMLTRRVEADRATPDTWFVQAYEEGITGWMGLHKDVLEAPTNDIASWVMPLYDRDGVQVGILWADVFVSTLNVLLRDTIAIEGDLAPSDLGYSVLVGKEGNVTATYNTRYRAEDLLGLSQVVLRQDVVSDLDGVFPDEVRAFAITSDMPQSDWHFVTILPDSALPDLPQHTVLQIVLISVIGLLALVWTINQFVGTTVSKPAKALGKAAINIGAGDLRQIIPYRLQTQQDEIGTIARSMEDMRHNLEMLYSTLEQRVQERTHDLDLARQEADDHAADLQAIYDESISVLSDYQLQSILDNFVQRILPLLEADYCGVWLLQPNRTNLQLVAHTYPNTILTNKTVKLGDGLVGLVTQEASPMMIENYSEFPRRLNLINIASIERAVCAPMMSSGEPLGAVMAGRPAHREPFTDKELRLLTLFSNLITPIVRNAQLFEELQEARNVADRANQVKTRFLASVTHELRTPLNLIINNMDFMRIGAFGDVTDEQSSRLDQTIRSAEHLLYLINDLLDVSKIEAGEMQLFIQPNDLRTVIDDALDTVDMLLDKDNKRSVVQFQTQIPDELPLISMDARRVRQVLVNLLSNAIKFTLQGEIQFTVAIEAPQWIRFSVRDTGIGVPEEELENLFVAFERSNNAKQSEIEGTGLGLVISRYLVEQHGGQLTVTSQLNEGSTFSFTLPLKQNGEIRATTEHLAVHLIDER